MILAYRVLKVRGTKRVSKENVLINHEGTEATRHMRHGEQENIQGTRL